MQVTAFSTAVNSLFFRGIGGHAEARVRPMRDAGESRRPELAVDTIVRHVRAHGRSWRVPCNSGGWCTSNPYVITEGTNEQHGVTILH